MKNCQFDFIIAQVTQPMNLVMELLKKTLNSNTEKSWVLVKLKMLQYELCREICDNSTLKETELFSCCLYYNEYFEYS